MRAADARRLLTVRHRRCLRLCVSLPFFSKTAPFLVFRCLSSLRLCLSLRCCRWENEGDGIADDTTAIVIFFLQNGAKSAGKKQEYAD